ncbi:MAG: 50S ribosomal protein L14 [Candidatus Omnitrophica bacterium]|nr:50S ribosomal protein L14 [Candidatus Omnitrophota bacterium]MCB9747657.1 50S ribosomal protein L14 [Candidatus Omnitrophota bacterium]
MIYMRTILNVADNSGARKASMIGVLHSKGRRCARVGDLIRVNIKESAPDAAVKKGEKAKAIIVRTKAPIRRPDGTYVRFDSNAVVIVDDAGNPKGTRVFGPVARELRNMEYMKIVSLAPEVI